MTCKQVRTNGTWEYVFKKAGLLEKPVHMTFVSEQGAMSMPSGLMSFAGLGHHFFSASARRPHPDD